MTRVVSIRFGNHIITHPRIVVAKTDIDDNRFSMNQKKKEGHLKKLSNSGALVLEAVGELI